MSANLEDSIDAAVATGQINGAVICAADAQGDFTYDRAFGHRTLLSGEKKPQQLDDVLYLASATKLVAAVAALQCVDDGLLTLTGDLSSIAPELAGKQVMTGFSGDGQPILEPATRQITLEMLLTHSSGIAYHFLDPLLAQWRAKFDVVEPGTRRPVTEAFRYPLTFQPGSSWMYGPGLDWAGLLVERVTGRTLGEHMNERISKPLGITDAQFYPVTREELRARLVDLNPDDPDAVGIAVTGGTGEMNRRSLGDMGGHGLFMPACDYIKILRSLLANDGKLLKTATVEDMFQDHLSPEATAGHQKALASPAGIFFGVGVDPGTKSGYGLSGMLTLEDVDGWYGERTLSWGGGQSLAWFIDRKNGLCGVGAIQSKVPVDTGLMGRLKQIFRQDMYRELEAWKGQ